LSYFKPELKLKLILVSDKEDVKWRDDCDNPRFKTYWPEADVEDDEGEGDNTKLKFAEIAAAL
jgi:hypothetical protein